MTLIVCENCNAERLEGETGWIEVADAGEYYCPMCHKEIHDE